MGNGFVWRELVQTVDSPERDGTKHRVLFVQWLTLPLAEKLREIRTYQQERPREIAGDSAWRRLIPQGEPEISVEHFLADLDWVLRLASREGFGDLNA